LKKLHLNRLVIYPLVAALMILTCSLSPSAADEKTMDPVRLADPFIGTGGHGHTYPGATLPFGMVQLSPDTRLSGWDGCSGYHYSDSVLHGFSHTHLSGTGCSDYGDILFMPVVGGVGLVGSGDGGSDSAELTGGSPAGTGPLCSSRFDHSSETASPGYYAVTLDDFGIRAELTAAPRAGFHRYTYPQGAEASLVIDLESRDRVLESRIRVVGPSDVEGLRRSSAWAKNQHVYFAARFSRPFESWLVSNGGELKPDVEEISGTNVKAQLMFGSLDGEELLVKVGISAVSAEGARKNLDNEIPSWSFDGTRKAAEAAWRSALGKISVDGGSKEQQVIFYTALYHAMLSPDLYMDVDGKYRGRDGCVHRADGFEYYTVFSLWDTYRAAHPLFTIIEPERTDDFIRTFLAQYEQGGRLPVWELAANETDCMIGYHAVPVIADAYIKGIRGFDAGKAFEAMKHSALEDRFGLDSYRKLGYIPADREGESVSRTLEYAYDDWCIAVMAAELGMEGDHEVFMDRAQSYRNIFDATTGFMRARANGRWFSPFDPSEVNLNYTEANSWQYSFYVPQDVEGLIELMGGREAFTAKLDALFAADTRTSGRDQPDITGLIGQYAHGNEPSHHMAYLYCYAGRPWKTQQRVRQIMDELYSTGPGGLCGNEDCGQMSAWFVLSALGLYPVTPGSDVYVIGSPLFPGAEIDLGNGRRFKVTAQGVSDKNLYIQSAMLNGEAYGRSYIRHGDIAAGGELRFVMGDEPCVQWGSGPEDVPRSSIEAADIITVPFVAAGPPVFNAPIEVILETDTEGAGIRYTLDGSEPDNGSSLYTGPFELDKSAVLKAAALDSAGRASRVMTSVFTRIPDGMGIEFISGYSSQYPAGGDLALLDGMRGSEDFRAGRWQGYHGVDLDVIVDLGSVRDVGRIAAGFLQDQRSWIFMPEEVAFFISEDGVSFEETGVVKNDVPKNKEDAVVKRFTVKIAEARTRYVRVRAVNIGFCPAWHPGAGHRAWIFADEISIE